MHCVLAKLILHEKMLVVFVRSLELAWERDLWQRWALQAVLDITPFLGRGAAKDTYNLLADGIRQLMLRVASVQETELASWAGQEERGTRPGVPPVKSQRNFTDPESRTMPIAAGACGSRGRA